METFSVLLALCAGNSSVTGEFPTKASDAELWCFPWSVNQQLSEQWRRRWFKTPSRPLWHHWNEEQANLHFWYLYSCFVSQPYTEISLNAIWLWCQHRHNQSTSCKLNVVDRVMMYYLGMGWVPYDKTKWLLNWGQSLKTSSRRKRHTMIIFQSILYI